VKCEEVNDLLSAFQDRELSVEEMTAIEGHLKDCAECAAKSNVMVGLSKIVKHWEGVRASETARRRLFEKASTVAPTSGGSLGPLTLWILGMIAAALLGGGAVALAYWYFGREARTEPPASGVRQTPAATCVAVEGRVELVQPDGARLDLRGRKDLVFGQEVFCDSGSAAQLELAGGISPAVLVLRGSGSLKLLAGELRLKGGRLMFRLPAGGPGPSAAQKLAVAAGQQWRVETTEAGTVGLIELGRDDTVRLAVLSGAAKLTSGSSGSGPSVAAGKEISLAADGRLEGPRDIVSKDGFGLLTAGPEDKK
jgi:hypothetical protein